MIDRFTKYSEEEEEEEEEEQEQEQEEEQEEEEEQEQEEPKRACYSLTRSTHTKKIQQQNDNKQTQYSTIISSQKLCQNKN